MSMQVLPKIEIQSFGKAHISAAKEVFDLQFGKDYLSTSDLETYLNHSYKGWVALENGVLIGVALAAIGTAKDLSTHFLVGVDWFRDTFGHFDNIALRKHLAIDPKWVGQGVGRQLVEFGIHELSSIVDVIVSVVWKESAAQSLGNILQSLGSYPIHQIDDYWKQDSLDKGYTCPGCQKMPCSCAMLVFAKDCKA